MLQANQTKLLLIGDCLSGGGAERVHAFLSNYFAAEGIAVHNAVIEDIVTYNYSGTLLNLGLLKKNYSGLRLKIERFRALRAYINIHRFDYIIDFRMHYRPWQELLLSRLVFKAPTVYTIHHYIIDWYLPQKTWLTQLIYKNAFGVVCMTDKIKQTIESRHGLTNVKKIFYPANFDYINQKLTAPFTPLPFEYIIGAGRMGEDNIKQFDKLIDAYAASTLPEEGIRLVLMGEGVFEEKLKHQAVALGLANMVVFTGFQENPYVYMRDALFFVLSSKNEGLPMVLIEALACGTPIVAFDCLTGPSEIIKHEQNGLLVPNQQVPALTEAINRMHNDTTLYTHCKTNAQPSAQKFAIEIIGRQWLDYFNIN